MRRGQYNNPDLDPSQLICKTHGQHTNWYWKTSGGRTRWMCRYCFQESKRRKRILYNYHKIRELGLLEAAEFYLAYVADPNHSTDPRMFIGRASIPSEGSQRIDTKFSRRTNLMNELVNQPVGHVGWECAKCGCYHTSPTFFDIDHIIEVKDGGTSVLSNLQILCPNCHKIKTHNLDPVT